VPSRQDQLHSYQYSVQRVVAALVTHDPDPSRSPLRRAGTTALVSLLIAAIAVGGAGLYGLLTGQSGVSATDPTVVFQEKGTGARFVYLESDHKLHPVLNYASGLLLFAGQTPSLKSVASEKLAAVPLGAPLGIPNAPDSLPSAAHDLLVERWSVCTDNQGSGGTPRSSLLVGDRLTDGTVAAQASHGALLVSDPARNIFLVYGNRRFPVPPDLQTQTLSVLGWNDQRPWPVSAAWINAVPVGPDLKAPAVPQSAGSSQFNGYRVGELVTDGSQVAVIMPDGQAGVTAMQAKLLQLELGKPVDIGADFAKLKGSGTVLSDANDANGLPPIVPDLVDSPPTRVCMTLPLGKHSDGVRIDPTVPLGVAVAGISSASGGNQADLVHVARGKGAVVVGPASASAPAGSGTVGIVTDTGLLYTLAGRDLLPKLGYGGVELQQIPAQLLALLPRGPSLDPAQARRTDPQG
jgi:type VII secretion protein EccB